MRLRILLWFVMLSVTASGQASKPLTSKAGFNYATQLGVVSFAHDQPPCLDIANDSLAPGDKLWLVNDQIPQRTVRVEIVKRLNGNCPVRASNDDPNESHYQLKLTAGRMEAPALAIAVVKSTQRHSRQSRAA